MGLDMYLMKTKKTKLLTSKTMRNLAEDLYSKNEHNEILFEPFEKLGLTYNYTRWQRFYITGMDQWKKYQLKENG